MALPMLQREEESGEGTSSQAQPPKVNCLWRERRAGLQAVPWATHTQKGMARAASHYTPASDGDGQSEGDGEPVEDTVMPGSGRIVARG